MEHIDMSLKDKIREAAKEAAKADAKTGEHDNAVMMLQLISKAAQARQQGMKREEFSQTLSDKERAYLGW